jgi:nucleotidyltransferase/DNA polymerase involved in DNA repair
MRVEELPGLETEQIARLRAAGISNCRQLVRASQRQERFQNLVSATKLPLETLHTLVQRAELCWVRGVGPATLVHLHEAGVDSLVTLASQEPNTLQAKLQEVTPRPPNLAVIEDWILQARRQNGRRAPRSTEATGQH